MKNPKKSSGKSWKTPWGPAVKVGERGKKATEERAKVVWDGPPAFPEVKRMNVQERAAGRKNRRKSRKSLADIPGAPAERLHRRRWYLRHGQPVPAEVEARAWMGR